MVSRPPVSGTLGLPPPMSGCPATLPAPVKSKDARSLPASFHASASVLPFVLYFSTSASNAGLICLFVGGGGASPVLDPVRASSVASLALLAPTPAKCVPSMGVKVPSTSAGYASPKPSPAGRPAIRFCVAWPVALIAGCTASAWDAIWAAVSAFSPNALVITAVSVFLNGMALNSANDAALIAPSSRACLVARVIAACGSSGCSFRACA